MNSFKTIFYLIVIGLLITATLKSKNSFLLRTDHAPRGMLSMQFAFNEAQQQQILKEWSSTYLNEQVYSRDTVITGKITGLETAKHQTQAGDYFIVLYILFFLLLFYKFRAELSTAIRSTYPRRWLLLFLLVLVAGIADLIENSYLLRALESEPHTRHRIPSAWKIYSPALLKYALLFVTLYYFSVKIKVLHHIRIWLKRLSSLLRSFVIYSWKFRLVLLGLLTLFLLLSITDQGQDLLVTINTSDWGIFWFYSVTTILALHNWLLPKIYDNLPQVNLKTITTAHLAFTDEHRREKLDFARFLGTLTFVIPAISIMITMQSYHIHYLVDSIPPLLIFVVIGVFYVNVLRYNWLDCIYKPNGVFKGTRYTVTMAVIFLTIIYWGRSEETREPYYLAYLALGFLLLSFAFLLTVSYRDCIRPFQHINISPLILAAGLLVSLLFMAFNFEAVVFFLTRNDRFYTLPVIIAALVAYTLFFSFLLVAGKRIGIQFITLFLLVIIYKSAVSITDIHNIHLVDRPGGQLKPQSLRLYTQSWLAHRKSEIAQHNQQDSLGFPVFFVNAYGGGIRAAAWTTMVVGRLDQLLQQQSATETSFNDFQHHVFSYSGASGGTIGISLLCAARLTQQGTKARETFYPENVLKLYQHDYLTATLAGLFGRDAFQSLIGFKLFPDRARIQEQNWEIYMRRHGIDYQVPMRTGWLPNMTEVPLFFSNTYDINTGFKGLIAPVQLDPTDFPGTVLLQDFIESNEDLYLSTAAFISARFPYVSPTAKFDERHHFMDGGTLENSGAETSLQVFQVFKSVWDSLQLNDPTYQNLKLKINFLSLPNSIPILDSVERVKNLYEPLAPALGLLNSTNGNTVKADTINRYLAQENNWNYFSISPRVVKIRDNVWPVLPVGWQISDYALQQMQLSLYSHQPVMDSILRQISLKANR
ncbi:hypothetical protein IWX76_002603 [Pedobacter sp. CAN_A7]|uniref:hypothetical protein n=1 Tax=Pedobacter sp. CAN_A7 TaxID=2787722 RepID=UPI0018CB705B